MNQENDPYPLAAALDHEVQALRKIVGLVPLSLHDLRDHPEGVAAVEAARLLIEVRNLFIRTRELLITIEAIRTREGGLNS